MAPGEDPLLSFLDEPDEPVRSRRRPGGGGATDRQTLMMRRTMAGVGVVIVLILLVFGVRGCLNARSDQAIEDYAASSAELLRASKLEGDSLFELLQGPGGTDEAATIITSLDGYRVESSELVDRARGLDVPGDLEGAQADLVEILELRRDGLAEVADSMRVALGDEERREGSDTVADQMQIFLASDVIDGRRFRPALGEILREKQLAAPGELPEETFLPNVEWLQEDFVADQVNALRTGTGTGAPEGGDAAPGLHGNGIAGVALGGTALTPGTPASVALTEDLAFEIQVQNQGDNTETDVTVRVTLGQGGDASELTETIDTIAAGEIQTVTIPLSEQPATGQSVPITVEVDDVPGEEVTDNNVQELSVIFTS